MWVQLVLGLVGLASSIIAMLKERNTLAQAEAAVIAQQLQRTLASVQKATDARAAVDAIPDDRLRDPDPNSRT